MAGFLLFLLNLVTGIPRALIGGWALSCYWLWFVMPVFGCPAINYLHAVGLMLTINFIVIASGISPMHSKEDESFTELAARGIFRDLAFCFIYPLAVVLAYVWHCFIG